MMNSQRSDPEKMNLIEEGKEIDIDEIIKHNESLKHKTISCYCLKCRKNRENINPRVSRNNKVTTMILSNVVVKNQDLIKNKKQLEY